MGSLTFAKGRAPMAKQELGTCEDFRRPSSILIDLECQSDLLRSIAALRMVDGAFVAPPVS